MRSITISWEGKELTVILEDDMGYYSTIGVFEGMLSEFLERPEQYEEHDG